MLVIPKVSKAVLVGHFSFSLGWFGAIIVFLVLVITGFNQTQTEIIRVCFISMEITTR